MSSRLSVAAVDLGATSGRVMVGVVAQGRVVLHPIARFPNLPVRAAGGLHWNVLELYRNVLEGLRAAAREHPDMASIGIDSWAVDYALMRQGRMLANPYHYRDERNRAAVAATHALVDPEQLYRRNGLQHLPFNTVYQLSADASTGMLPLAETMLLIPDLLAYWLTGRAVAERTNASTTGLLSVTTGEWDEELAGRLGIAVSLLPELVSAGEPIGPLAPEVAADLATTASVLAVGSHDTASAVAAVPATDQNFAYISCGTWGLVGLELAGPVLSEASRLAGFTNERGLVGSIRYLHNVMGMWLLNESVRWWERSGERLDVGGLAAQAATLQAPPDLFDANDPSFLAPDNMPARIEQWLSSRGLSVPGSRVGLVRCIVESLAEAFAQTVRTAARLAEHPVDVVHIVGGGSQNALLCQLVADRLGLPVLAGPVEATAIGNVLVQAQAQEAIEPGLAALRSVVARSFRPARYEPAR